MPPLPGQSFTAVLGLAMLGRKVLGSVGFAPVPAPPVPSAPVGVVGLIESDGARGGYTVPQEFLSHPQSRLVPIHEPIRLLPTLAPQTYRGETVAAELRGSASGEASVEFLPRSHEASAVATVRGGSIGAASAVLVRKSFASKGLAGIECKASAVAVVDRESVRRADEMFLLTGDLILAEEL